jgi:adenylate kinase
MVMDAKPLVLIMLGAPGAGKGTYCKFLIERFKTPQISTGDMFRAAVKARTPLGVEAKKYMDQGTLVPDAVTIGLVKERVSQADCKPGFILDGFPRTVPQAEALDGVLKSLGLELKSVVNLIVDKDILFKRLTGRRMCRKCSQGNFNIFTLPPKKDGVCDYCGGELYQRDDDKEDVINKRLQVYENQTAPLVDYYQKKGKLIAMPSNGKIEEMTGKIIRAIES